MFEAAIAALKVDKGACVFADDRKSSIENAIKFGLSALLFPSHAPYGHVYLERIFQEMDIL
jgi:FMN phosphatase YigB (HAD superfamily)